MKLALEKGLRATLVAAVGDRVNNQVVNQYAKTVTFPYVIFMLNAGEDMNLQRRGQADLRYTIKAVVEEGGNAALLAAQIAQDIYTALHEVTFSIDPPYKVYRSQRLSIVKYVTTDDKKQFFHDGGVYRFRVSEEF